MQSCARGRVSERSWTRPGEQRGAHEGGGGVAVRWMGLDAQLGCGPSPGPMAQPFLPTTLLGVRA